MKEPNTLKDHLVLEYANQSRERKGTPVCDRYSRLEIIEDPLSPSHAEVKRRRPTTRSGSSILTLPHHQASLCQQCHVMSCHMPHHYG